MAHRDWRRSERTRGCATSVPRCSTSCSARTSSTKTTGPTLEAQDHRKPKEPISSLLKRKAVQGGRGGINWKLTSCKEGESTGEIERCIFLMKKALAHMDFYKKCNNLTFLGMTAIMASGAKILNSRPCLQLEDGKFSLPWISFKCHF